MILLTAAEHRTILETMSSIMSNLGLLIGYILFTFAMKSTGWLKTLISGIKEGIGLGHKAPMSAV